MKLSDYKGEEALDVLADLIEPVADICADKEIARCVKEGGKKISAVKIAIKRHKKSVIEILATLDGKTPEEYEVNVLTLPLKLIEILNDPEVMELFTSAGQTGGAKSSGSASENAE